MKKKFWIIGIALTSVIFIILITILIVTNSKNVKTDNEQYEIYGDENLVYVSTSPNIERDYCDGMIITDVESVIQSLEYVKDELGIVSLDDLELESSEGNESFSTFRFKQLYRGIRVNDGGLIVYVGADRKTQGIINYYKKFSDDIDITDKMTQKERDARVLEEINLSSEYITLREKIIFVNEDVARFAYLYKISRGLEHYEVIIDENTGKLLQEPYTNIIID